MVFTVTCIDVVPFSMNTVVPLRGRKLLPFRVYETVVPAVPEFGIMDAKVGFGIGDTMNVVVAGTVDFPSAEDALTYQVFNGASLGMNTLPIICVVVTLYRVALNGWFWVLFQNVTFIAPSWVWKYLPVTVKATVVFR